MSANLQNVLVVVGVVAAICAFAFLFCKLYERVVERHRKAAGDAAKARDEGYVFIPDLLECYAFNDVRGIFRVLKSVIETLHDPVAKSEARDRFLRRQLELACQDTERLKTVARIVSQYAPAVAAVNAAVAVAVPPVAPIAAPVVAAVAAAGQVADTVA